MASLARRLVLAAVVVVSGCGTGSRGPSAPSAGSVETKPREPERLRIRRGGPVPVRPEDGLAP